MNEIECISCNTKNPTTVESCICCGSSLNQKQEMTSNAKDFNESSNQTGSIIDKQEEIPKQTKPDDIKITGNDEKDQSEAQDGSIPEVTVVKPTWFKRTVNKLKKLILGPEQEAEDIPSRKIDLILRNAAFSRIITIFSSILITIIFKIIIAISFSNGSLIYRIFLPAGEWFQRVIPTIILFLFFWVMVDNLLKILRQIQEEKYLKYKHFVDIVDSIQSESLSFILSLLNGLEKQIKRGKVFKYIFPLIDHMNATDDIQRSHEFFRHQSDVESDNTVSGYAIARIFIWAMPIIGFIGTVVGISIAVGNFSGFLTGDIDDIELIKKELSHVAGGLSFAFDTTLIGLAASLIAMICTSLVQKREESFLAEIERIGISIISKNHKQPSPASLVESKESYFDLSKLPLRLEQNEKLIMSKLRDLGVYSEKLKETFNKGTNQFIKSSDLLAEKVESLLPSQIVTENITRELGTFNQLIKEMNEDFIKKKFQELEDYSEKLKVTFQNNTNQFKKSSDLLAEKVESLLPSQRITENITKELSTFNKLISGMGEAQDKLISFVKELSGPLEFKLVSSQNDSSSQKIEFLD